MGCQDIIHKTPYHYYNIVHYIGYIKYYNIQYYSINTTIYKYSQLKTDAWQKQTAMQMS